jgi:hypothetical protein
MSSGSPDSDCRIHIERKPFEEAVHDVMEGSSRWEVKVHDHGLVALLDVMPRFAPAGKTADFAIVQAARVSYGQGTRQVNEDRGLIRYLARHRHTTPFEMVEFKFHHVMPIFIARQWIRHRTACLAGDALLSFDLPGAERRGRRQHYGMTMQRLHRLWHEGAMPIRPAKRKAVALDRIETGRLYSIPGLSQLVGRREETLRNMVRDGYLAGQRMGGRIYVQGEAWRQWALSRTELRIAMRDRLRRMHLRMCDEATGEILHTRITDVWESGMKPVFRVTLENGYSLKMTRDHRCLTDRGWMTLGEATSLRLAENGAVTWDGSAPAMAVNGDALHRSPDWLSQCKSAGSGVQRMADESGVSYHTIRKNLCLHGLSFTPTERALQSGKSQRGQRRSFHRGTLATRKRLPRPTRLMRGWSRIARLEYAGEEMTYDMEVAGPSSPTASSFITASMSTVRDTLS